jgi:hypothetical protein
VDVQEPEAVGADTPAAQMDTVKNPLIVTANPRPTDPTIPLGTRVDRVGAVDAKETVEDDEEPPAPGMVKGPYAVETFPVAVEGGYLYLVIDVVDVAASPPSRNEIRAAR